jgi:hypothetical protein
MQQMSDELRMLQTSVLDLKDPKVIPKKKLYHARYYQARREARLQEACEGLLPNLDQAIFRKRDTRLETHFPQWARAAFKFARVSGGRPYKFLEWLCFHWNRTTYHHQPITRSSGYWHIFVGLTTNANGGQKPLRVKLTCVDLFGKTKNAFQTLAQCASFSEGRWWQFGAQVLFPLVEFMAEEHPKEWAAAADHFKKVLRIMSGSKGMQRLKGDLYWDPRLGPAEMRKAWPQVQSHILSAHQACQKGLCSKKEPHTEITASASCDAVSPKE